MRLPYKILIIALALIYSSSISKAQDERIIIEEPIDSLSWSLDLINSLLYSDSEWYLTERGYRKPIKGLVNHVQDSPIDTSIVKVSSLLNREDMLYLFDRRPNDIKDLDKVNGYVGSEEMLSQVEYIKRSIYDKYAATPPAIPEELIEKAATEAPKLPEVEPLEYYNYAESRVPDSFRDRLLKNFAQKHLIDQQVPEVKLDSIRELFVDSMIIVYNNELATEYVDSVANSYIDEYVTQESEIESGNYVSSTMQRNQEVLYNYNDSTVNVKNRQAAAAISYLNTIAEREAVKLDFSNSTGSTSTLWTDNQNTPYRNRLFVQNAQNDSVQIIIENRGKRTSNIYIDDIVEISRFNVTKTNNEVLRPEKVKMKSIVSDKRTGPAASPWTLNGQAALGFTQTSLTNWAAGGNSSYSVLFSGSYNANYKTTTESWTNNINLRIGAIKQDNEVLNKSEDKIAITSKYGITAFKDWSYTADLSFNTQMAKGYTNKGTENEVITSKWLAPGYTTLSIGMDYKPNKVFTFFASPIAGKVTFVTDTVMIDQTNYSIAEDKKAYWEPGLTLKSTYTKSLREDITLATNASFFTSYTEFMERVQVTWEGKINMQVNQYIALSLLCNMIYDTNVLFDTDDLDTDGNTIKKAKVQFKEAFTFGFTYKLY